MGDGCGGGGAGTACGAAVWDHATSVIASVSNSVAAILRRPVIAADRKANDPSPEFIPLAPEVKRFKPDS
jgi:hypothetical protein